jgi:hypothetical protein
VGLVYFASNISTALSSWFNEREDRLRQENHRLTEGVEILKRATAFFAKEIR